MAPSGGQEAQICDSETFGDSDFVVVANRLPVDLERLPDGSTTWKRSPGGLVTALEPVLRRRRGAWVGWPGVTTTGPNPTSTCWTAPSSKTSWNFIRYG